MQEYKGPERRKGLELCFDTNEPGYHERVSAKTDQIFFSSPKLYDGSGKRKQGMPGKFFIPLKTNEPDDVVYATQMVARGPMTRGEYNELKHSRFVYPDRRKQ